MKKGRKPIRAAFFDVDGTLAAMDTHVIPDSTRDALDRLKKRGIRVLLSTGRHELEIEEENILPGISWDGAVWMNGQLCELDGKTLSERRLTSEQLLVLKEFLEEQKISCIFLERHAIYCNFHNRRLEEGQSEVGSRLPQVRSMEGLETRGVYQAIPFLNAEEETILLKKLTGCTVNRWNDAVVDLISAEGGKDRGIQTLCDAMGITAEEIIAFGDGENDVSMLRMAGIGVAMGNAVEAAKAAADYVTDRIEDDGVRNALEHFGVI